MAARDRGVGQQLRDLVPQPWKLGFHNVPNDVEIDTEIAVDAHPAVSSDRHGLAQDLVADERVEALLSDQVDPTVEEFLDLFTERHELAVTCRVGGAPMRRIGSDGRAVDLTSRVIDPLDAAPGRQALEMAVDDYWAARKIPLTSCPTLQQLICLREYLGDADLAGRVHHARNALSRACHHHRYELPPSAGELEGRLEVVESWLSVSSSKVVR